MTETEAETIALRVLAWLAGDGDLMPVFLGASGLTAGELALRAEDRDLLAAVLDFVLMDDAWLMRIGAETGMDPSLPGLARSHFPGGQDPNWT